MIVHLFPGQGSQHVGMGAELFKRYPQLVEQADEVLGYSIKTLCLEDPRSELSQTQFTQPALFIVNALSYLARIDDGEAQPDFVAGHSLGEYDALFAAGVVDFEQGLRLVQRRGALMSQVRGGGMAAVVGLDEQGVLDVIAPPPRSREHQLAEAGGGGWCRHRYRGRPRSFREAWCSLRDA